MRALYAAVVLCVLASCKGRSERQVGTLPPPPTLPQVDGGAVGAPSSGAPRALAAANRAFEHLPPDRRFLLAFDQVDRIFDAASTSHAAARANADGSWSIEKTDKSGATTGIVQLADAADFEPLMDAVTAYAARYVSPAMKGAAPRLPPAEVVAIPLAHKAIAVLSGADRAWKTASERPLAARRATSALVGLVFGTYDRLEVADELPARALATAAVARALGAPASASVEALLARVLGYGAAALRLAPDNAPDAVAAYAAFDNARLLKVATTSPFAKIAWLRRLALQKDEPEMRVWVGRELARERLSVPVLATEGIGAAQLESTASLASRFPPIALAEAMDASGDLAQESGPAHERALAALAGKAGSSDAALEALGTSRSRVLLAYDKAVAALPHRDGPFRDSALERDYLDTNMVAAMVAVERHAWSLSSPAASADQVNELAEPAAPRTKAFRTFFAATVAALTTAKPLDVAAHALAPSPLGAGARVTILSNIASRLDGADGAKVGRGLLGRMDSRPWGRGHAAWASESLLKNPRASEALLRSVAGVSGGTQASSESRILRLDRDPEKILRFVRWPAYRAHERAQLVAWAIHQKVGDRAVLDGIADELLRERALDWDVQHEFVKLFDVADPARARAIVQRWLDRKSGEASGGLGDVGARIALAAILRREHKYDEAIQVLEPAAETWQAGAIGALAVTHAEANHPAEADKLGVRMLQRYPQSVNAVATLARVRWINKDFAGAAAVLAKPPKPITDAQMNYHVASVFAALFSDKPEQAAAAGEALRAAKLPVLADLCGGSLLVDYKSYAAALAVLQPKPTSHVFIPDTEHEKSRYTATTRELTFEAILGGKGKDEAVKWLRAAVGKDPRLYYGTVYEAYRRDKLEVVLDADLQVTHTPDDPASDWTMRLAAQLRRDGKIVNADEARKAFAKAPNARYSTYGRYLLGDIDADTVEKLAQSAKATCELAYYMAARAIGDGHHGDAVDLLRVATDTASTSDAEYNWANDDLAKYRALTRPLASLPPGLPRALIEPTKPAE